MTIRKIPWDVAQEKVAIHMGRTMTAMRPQSRRRLLKLYKQWSYDLACGLALMIFIVCVFYAVDQFAALCEARYWCAPSHRQAETRQGGFSGTGSNIRSVLVRARRPRTAN